MKFLTNQISYTMSQDNKIKVLFLMMAGLLISNILLIAIIFFGPEARKPVSGHRPEGPKFFIIERLELNPQQIKQYEVLIENHRSQIREKEEVIMEQKEALYEGLKSDLALEKQDALLKNINQTQLEIEIIHYAHFQDIKKICNASQLEKFNDLAEDFTHLFSKPRHRR